MTFSGDTGDRTVASPDAATSNESSARTADADLKALTEAFETFTRTTASMEESYRRLEERIQSLDRELQEKNVQLSLTTEYLNAILDSMTDGVVAVDPKGFVTTANPAAAEILGREGEALIGKPYADIFGRPCPVSRANEFREIETGSHGTIPVSERSAPIAGRGGEHLGTVQVFQDLSEIEALRAEVRRKERLATLGEMAATVAHEIRNPLGGIRGFAALLEQDIDESDPRRRLVGKILAGTRSLDRVVNELLEYTRPVELRLERFDCRDLVESALAFLDRIPEGIAVANDVPAGIALYVDEQKLRQTLLNILLNAIQSIEGAGRILIRAVEFDRHVEIAVSDTGCGIAPEHLDKLFMPFFTTREKGTGLGLAAAAKTVESHGGGIAVESAPGEGAVFRIRLPQNG